MVDFNRTVNLPFSFTEFGTCPAPVAGQPHPRSGDGRRAGADPGDRGIGGPAVGCQEPGAGAGMKFCTFTLIDNSPDPITGERLTHRGAVRGRRPAGAVGRGTGLRRLRRRRAACPAVHLVVAAGRSRLHRGGHQPDQVAHHGDRAVPAGPGSGGGGLRHPGPAVRRPAGHHHRQGQRSRSERAVRLRHRRPVGPQRREVRTAAAAAPGGEGHLVRHLPSRPGRGDHPAPAAAGRRCPSGTARRHPPSPPNWPPSGAIRCSPPTVFTRWPSTPG